MPRYRVIREVVVTAEDEDEAEEVAALGDGLELSVQVEEADGW